MADTGTAVATGDLITAAKMSLKLETTADRPALGITDNSGAGIYAMNIVVASTYGADRALTITTGDAARGITLSGDLSIAGNFTTAGALITSGAYSLTLTTTATTVATIPAGTVTLADLGTAQTIAGAKTFGSSLLKMNNPAATFAYTFVAGALLASYNITLPTLGASDVMVCEAHGATLTNKTLTSPTINTATIAGGTATALTGLGIRSTGAAFDLTIASTEVFTVGRTLTIVLGNAARTLTLGGDVTTVGALTTAAAFTTTGAGNAITLTATGATVATLPAGTVTLAQLGTNTFTGAQTLDGNVDTVFNPTTSPIIDIGADVFETGTFIDIAYDTAETLTGALIGVNLNLNTNVTLSNQAVNGIIVAMPATYGNGAEVGVQVTGDGQTINIGNDADVYVSLAKASSVDINIQGVSPVFDIGADVLAGGMFVSIAYDTAQTLASALTAIDIDMGTNVTTGGAGSGNIKGLHLDLGPLALAATYNGTIYGLHLECDPTLTDEAITGILLTMPATFGTGTEIGIQVTGDGQTVNIVNDTDLYISMAKASSVDISIQGISPVFDIGADVLEAGYIFSVDYDTAETTTGDLYIFDTLRAANNLTLGGDLYGINLDFSTRVVAAADRDVIGYRLLTPALTSAGANATAMTGFSLPTAGALVMNNAGGSISWYGMNIQLPNITQTAGAMTAIGVQLTEGTTTSGTANAININGSVDTILNFSASPIIDIGADVFSAGTFVDLAFDTIETLTAALTGVKVDWDTVIVTTGAAGTGNITPFWADLGQLTVNATYNATIYGARLDLDFTVGGAETIYGIGLVMPAVYGAGAEVGIHLTGDGQTINIGNDADLYMSLAKANSVDINIQGITPVIDIGADVFSTGTFVDIAFDTAETATGVLIGASINLNTNLTPLSGQDITGYTTQTAAFTNAAATATVITGYQLPTAGALVSNNAGATITWYGADLQMPNITQTSGAMTATGIRITEGTTTSGTATGLTINVTRAIALTKASDIILAANTAAVLDISDGTTNLLRLNSQTGTDGVTALTITGVAPTFASANGSTYRVAAIAAITLTLTGGTGVTALSGLGLNIGAPTVTSEDATVVTLASNLYVAAPVAAGGGPASFTAGYSAHFASQIRLDGNLSMANAAYDIVCKAATASALQITDGTNTLLDIDTRTTTDNAEIWTIDGPNATIVSAGGSTYRMMQINPYSVTLTGGVQVTAMDGLALYLSAPTVTSEAATTVVTASTLYIALPVAAGGGPVTITNHYIVNTGAAGCFCTAAGVWTSVSNREAKMDIETVKPTSIGKLLSDLKVVSYKRRDPSDGGYKRFGVVADEAPDFLKTVGGQGMAAIDMAGFALAAAKWLQSKNEQLEKRLAQLEKKLATA